MEQVLTNQNVMDKQKQIQRQEEHLELLRWINYHKQWEEDFKVITGNEWNCYKNSKDYEMNMICLEHDEIYGGFYNMTGVHLINIDDFVSMIYIDDGKNDIEIVVNIDDKEEKYIIGV